MLRLGLTACLVLFSSLSTYVWADEDGSFTNYEAIVNELKASAEEKPMPTHTEVNWQDVALHGGLAFATSFMDVSSPSGTAGAGLLKGVEVSLGMNLYSEKFRGEAAFTMYGQDGLQNGLKADLHEFEARALYLPSLNDKTTVRLGLGLAARYLDLQDTSHGSATYDATTPVSVLIVGFERKIAPSLTLGPDLSYRSALVSDSFDKTAWNASFRLNATF